MMSNLWDCVFPEDEKPPVSEYSYSTLHSVQNILCKMVSVQ